MGRSGSWTRRLGVGMIIIGSVMLLARGTEAAPGEGKGAADETLVGGAGESNDAREKAMALCKEGKMLDALPLLDVVLRKNPKDHEVAEDLAIALMMSANTGSDVGVQEGKRIRARKVLLKAQELGDESNLLQVLLDGLPENGKVKPFSERREVNDAMLEGEVAFARGNLDKAIKSYGQALELDPKQYVAALFCGDMYFRQDKQGEAGKWFAKAIKIDANRETAYRYWGDALMKEGKMEEARGKFIDAVVAEPYGRAPWIGLKQWAEKNGGRLDFKRWEPADEGDDKVDTAVSKAYKALREVWKSEKFKKAFPQESEYRHSVREEVEALSRVVETAEKMAKDNGGDLSGPVAMLIEVKKAGLLEAYVVLVCADEGIAQDFEKYREGNRDKLRQYLGEFVVGKTAGKKEPGSP